MKLIPITTNKYDDYRLDVIFGAYKWDPQFLDNSTIAKHVLVLTEEEHETLRRQTAELYKETVLAENEINENPGLYKDLKMPLKIRRNLKRMRNYDADKHIRLMRFDFHPTTDGWAVSEVNSDVPGGFAEASVMPQYAMKVLGYDNYCYIDFGEIFIRKIEQKVRHGGCIMMIHCTCYSDDRQVMQFIGSRLEEKGYRIIYAAADHLRFDNHEAYSILDGNECKADAIIRFTPIEWLVDMKPKRWHGYFDTHTVSCNHPIGVYAQTKRFPLVWNALEKRGIMMKTWSELLPETVEIKKAKGDDSYIFKPVWGRVGEAITIKEACKDDEYEKILKDVKRHPRKYLAQKRFDSLPLTDSDGGTYHVCLGSFCIEGDSAGYYARISKTPRIDSGAADIPVLIEASAGSNKHISEKTIVYLGREAYKIWAPKNVKWSSWARPLPFVTYDNTQSQYIGSFDTPNTDYIKTISKDTAIILDLPGYESILEGIALARQGFRPVPLFNGTAEQQGSMALVDNHSIANVLMIMTPVLQEIEIPGDAPPVFMLDSCRLHTRKFHVSEYDNSWDIYAQDIPSADYFLSNGIKKIAIRGMKLSRDIKKIMRKFKKKGLNVFFVKT